MNVVITRHAEARMQQRGISPATLSLLLRYGSRARATKGAELVYFDKKARRRLIKDCDQDAIKRDSKQLKTYAVCKGPVVLTAGKLYKRVRR